MTSVLSLVESCSDYRFSLYHPDSTAGLVQLQYNTKHLNSKLGWKIYLSPYTNQDNVRHRGPDKAFLTILSFVP